jgi:DNA polymerase-3 subunit gamma/tau
LSAAFEIAHTIFSQGKDILQFVESLTDHFRTLLLIKLSGIDAPFLNLSEADKSRYLASAKIYTQEQCLTLLDYLVEAQNKIRYHASSKIALESILLHIMRSHRRLPIEFLVKRLSELENAIGAPASVPAPASVAAPAPAPAPVAAPVSAPIPTPPPPKPITPPPSSSISIDPTPTPADLGIVKKTAPKPPPVKNYPSEAFSRPEPVKEVTPSPPPPAAPPQGKPGRYDTLLQFAAVELEGTIQRKTHKT